MGKKFDQNACKVNLKLATTRLRLQRTKRDNTIKNQKREIAELLKAGKDESARIKVESVIRDDFIIEAHDILELFCELLQARLGVIEASKDCPADIKEAIASLIYAAPRTDIKELTIVRELLINKYGKEFANEAMSNKNNIVNARIVHKLSIQTPENYLVYQYLNEIAKAYNVDWKANFEVENIGHPPIPESGNLVTPTPFSEPVQSFFPEPPKSAPPPQFPPPYSSSHQFPDVPAPSFGAPSQPMNFPSPPSFPSFPSPPVGNSSPIPPPNNVGNIPSFPNFPTSPNGNNGGNIPGSPDFSFPTPPSNFGTLRDNNNSNVPSFPTPPGNSNPEEPPQDSNIPDFDELTARFEKLKKRDV